MCFIFGNMDHSSLPFLQVTLCPENGWLETIVRSSIHFLIQNDCRNGASSPPAPFPALMYHRDTEELCMAVPNFHPSMSFTRASAFSTLQCSHMWTHECMHMHSHIEPYFRSSLNTCSFPSSDFHTTHLHKVTIIYKNVIMLA